ncbi:alkaline phosphatase synthesis sensor protein PhoR [bacterium BMS3Bbin03]|nr:alkaline phosphatase synthesis sensor protein PhoR [bacterium BMS3Bbin03]
MTQIQTQNRADTNNMEQRWELSQKQMLLFSRDFARIYRAERAKRELLEFLHDKLRAIVDSMSDGMVATDEDFNVLDVNKTFERMFQIKSDDMRGRALKKVLPYPELERSIRNMRVQNKHFQSLELYVNRDQDYYFEANISHVKGPRGENRGYVFLFQDVTDKMRFDRIKSRFITFASHEIRTPLHGLLGFLNVIYDNLHDRLSDEEKKYFQFLLDSGENLRTVVEEMLEMSTLQDENSKLRRSHISLKKLIHSAIEKVALEQEAMSVKVELHAPEQSMIFFGEPDLLVKAFESIIKNIIIYTLPDSVVFIQLTESEALYKIEFISPGITLTAEEVDIMISDFYQMEAQITKVADGIELGFPLAKDIVQWHGGRLIIPDQEEFSIIIELPRRQAKGETEKS